MEQATPTYKAYAKINIGLRILERRPDGYHNIETVFHRIDLFDDIAFAPAETTHIVSSSPDAPSDESNICHKAALLLQEHLHVNNGVRISITKRIPVGAGLGGGSSDAALVLRNLPGFWHRSVDEKTLSEFALKLGADVPFFLGNSSAIGKGRGDMLEFFDLAVPYNILVCSPGIHVSTAWAYQGVKPNIGTHEKSTKEILLQGLKNPLLLSDLRNDFEEAVFDKFPLIAEVKQNMLRGRADFASMSGSGSSVYGFFGTEADATRVSDTLRLKGFRTFLTKPNFKP